LVQVKCAPTNEATHSGGSRRNIHADCQKHGKQAKYVGSYTNIFSYA